MKKFILILLAAGQSTRFRENKQLHKINNKTIFEICLNNIKKLNLDIKVLPIVPKNKFNIFKNICLSYNTLDPIVGGTSRQKSVYNGLKYLSNKNVTSVFIHDSARPIISKSVINEMLKNENHEFSCIVPTLEVSYAIRKKQPKNKYKFLNKNNYILFQTPQLCNFQDLLISHKKSTKEYDDESSLLMDNGFKIKTILGDPKSLKITYYNDLLLIKPFLEENMNTYITKVGIGYDVHKLIKKNITSSDKIFKLGGYAIDIDYYLKGHSDADVLLHSITDSILGALNNLDIGQHFPPTDKKWKNKDSFIFLNYALNLLKQSHGEINHIDVIIITETPKISDYVDDIKTCISKNTTISKNIISIKGKSNEAIGFIGRKEGIAVLTNTTISIKND